MSKNNLNEILFAFSEEIRLRIVMLLSHDSLLCVKCIVNTIDAPQPTISRHLSLLRRIGVVEVQKDKQHCYYSLKKNGPFIELKKGLVDVFHGSLKEKNPFKKDRENLEKIGKVCCEDCTIKPFHSLKQ